MADTPDRPASDFAAIILGADERQRQEAIERLHVRPPDVGTWQPRDEPLPDPGFLADVRSAVALWRGNWVVPFLVGLIGLGIALPNLIPSHPTCTVDAYGVKRCIDGTRIGLQLLSLPALLFQIGLSGSTRLWYVRRLEGQTVGVGQLWDLTWSCFWRFFRLGLLVFAMSIPFGIALLSLESSGDHVAALVVSYGYAVALDLALTFATPGLALLDDKASSAFGKGLGLLRRSWPHSAPYALVPPFALEVVGKLSSNPAVSVAFTVVGPLLVLVFAGATTQFVLRRYVPLPRR